MTGVLIAIVGALSFVLAANARAPRRSLALLVPSWVVAYLVVELPIHLAVIGGLIIAVVALLGGGLGGTVGVVGLVLWALASAWVLPYAFTSLRTRLDVQGRPDDFEAGELDAGGPSIPWWHLVFPMLMWWHPAVTVRRGLVYATVGERKLRFDLTRPKDYEDRPPLPAVINVHGGVWMAGTRVEQGVPLMNHLAANGWATVNIDYRLSPKATMPDHIQDVKRAIAYVREHAAELHIDPTYIAITGGSAGGHLAALAALTADDPLFQPGFESADTTLQVCVPFYGAYDLVDEHHKAEPALRHLVEKYVVKAKIEEQPERFYSISPLHRLRADAPPFFVVHGSGDTILPVQGSRHFVAKLREVSQQPVLYAEMAGGQHAFDCIASRRTAPVIRAIERFLAVSYATRNQSAEATERAAEDALTS